LDPIGADILHDKPIEGIALNNEQNASSCIDGGSSFFELVVKYAATVNLNAKLRQNFDIN
jgi:hypothetical protein